MFSTSIEVIPYTLYTIKPGEPENKEIKEGKIPKQWAENPHVLR